jgi:DNA-binding beta-propeller fold protein YncE
MVLSLGLVVIALALSATVGHGAHAQTRASADRAAGDSEMMEKQLEGYARAPDFPSDLEWLNTDRPLTLGDLHGKLVLLDFWTFCCINCMHIIPDLKKLEEKYTEELVVIGVHSAKFTNEKQTESIRQAILRYDIRHPVINDRDLEVWTQYGVHAWPSLVLINPNGRIIGTHSGEGIYEPFDVILSQAVAYFTANGQLRRGPLALSLEGARRPSTLLSFPGKVSADSIGRRLFITDSNHDRIIITDPDGAILDVIGSGETGSADGSFEDAQFDRPQGTTLVDSVLYIADTENHLIRAANLQTRRVTTFLGTGEQARVFNVPGRGRAIALSSPWDVVADAGKLYIAMAGSHQLWVADLATGEALPHAGSGREGRLDGPLRAAALAQPSGITTNGKRLYFADSETSSIRSASLTNGDVETIVGEDLFEFGDVDGPATVARLQHPLGIVANDGLLYVTDTYNSKIKIIDPEKKTSTTYAGDGTAGYADGQRSEARFSEPSGLAVLDGNLYVADCNNHLIRVIDLTTGLVRTLDLQNRGRLAQRSMDHFSGRSVTLPAQTIRAGSGHAALAVAAPPGYHLTAEAPIMVRWRSDDEGVVRFRVQPSEIDFSNSPTVLDLPVEVHPGRSDLVFDAVLYFCEDGSKLCLVDQVRVIAPVTVDRDGPDRLEIRIIAQATATP